MGRSPEGKRPIRRKGSLSTKTQALDQRPVTVDVDVGQVTQQAAALTHQQKQSTTRVVVVLVLLEVLREVLDATREHRDLNLWGSGVTGVGCIFIDDRLLDFSFKSHSW